MEDEDAGGQLPQSTGLLSPRRIEAIHIAFTKVFDAACKQGIIRDPSTYKSFDHVFEKAMKRQRGEDVDSQSGELRPIESLGGDVEDEPMDIVEETMTTTMTMTMITAKSVTPVEKDGGVGAQSVQVVANLKDVGKDVEMNFSDDEDDHTASKESLQRVKRRRRQPDYSPGQIDEDITFQKPKRLRHSEPPVPNHPRTQSPRRKTFTPQRIHRSSYDSSEPSPPTAPSYLHYLVNGQYLYLGLEPLKTVTIVCNRSQLPPPRDRHIPLHTRRKARSRRIMLDKLWEIHYLLERQRKADPNRPPTKLPSIIPPGTKLPKTPPSKSKKVGPVRPPPQPSSTYFRDSTAAAAAAVAHDDYEDWESDVVVPLRGFRKGTVRRGGPLVKSNVPIHPSGWKALGKGSRGPNKRTLGRSAGTTRADVAAAAVAATASAASVQEPRRSGRVTNGVGVMGKRGSPEL